MLIGWTTVETRTQAETIAAGLLENRLAACVQVEGPIRSHYRWEGKHQSAEEYRLTVKFLREQANELEVWLQQHHPYDTPEWVVVAAEHVAEKYLSWARASSTSVPL